MVRTNQAHDYAFAFFEIALENQKLLKYKKEIELIDFVFANNSEYLSVLDAAFLSIDQKEDFIKKAFQKNLSKLTYFFIFLLIKKHRIKHFHVIAQEFYKLINQELRVFSGIVYSTIKLSDDEIKNITKKIIKDLKIKKLSLVNKIDSTLIGGIKIEVEEFVIDYSVASQLNELQNNLIRRRH